MIARAKPSRPARHLLVLDIGHSTIKAGIWDGSDLRAPQRWPTADVNQDAPMIRQLWAAMETPKQAIACAAVSKRLQAIRNTVQEVVDSELLVVGQELPVPISLSVDKPESVGTDRTCCAAAAYHIEGTACAVVDVGTAITVDCVNDRGEFIGGAILPGLNLQAAALADGTHTLPLVDPQVPQRALGGQTDEAIQSGIIYGTVGAIKELVERYAETLGQWPTLIMTGGACELLGRELQIVDKISPHLCLRGVALAYEQLFRS